MILPPYNSEIGYKLDLKSRPLAWIQIADSMEARKKHALVAYGQHLFMFGFAPGIEKYDTVTDSWTIVSALPTNANRNL